MSKSKWKLNFYSSNIIKKFHNFLFFKKKPKNRFTYNRSSHIPFFFINKIIRVHKGNFFNFIYIDIYSLGKKFGQFSFTRKPFHYPLKKKKK